MEMSQHGVWGGVMFLQRDRDYAGDMNNEWLNTLLDQRNVKCMDLGDARAHSCCHLGVRAGKDTLP